EVNDNPNIDVGVEDQVLKDSLYNTIMEEFVNRIDKLKMRKDREPAMPAEIVKLLNLQVVR
ncbi:MAG: hypothetical protein ABIW76_23975, partial [Fibrobacteria bacterium]